MRVRQTKSFMLFRKISLCLLISLPYFTDDPKLNFITILIIAFPIYGVDFKVVNSSLRMY